jgi:alpha-1,2-mannosyltransferase
MILPLLLLGSKLLAAVWSPISDCDEVFNYWEPLHFWLFKRGFQTWEYSPEFSIRSWAYLLIHGWPWKPFAMDGPLIFYGHRIFLAILSLIVDLWVYYSILKNVHASVAKYYLVMMMASAGHFISTAAFLPSSTAMLCTGMAMAASLQIPSRGRTFATLLPLAFGSIWAWPFVGVFSFPFVFEDLYSSVQRWKRLRHYLEIILVCFLVFLVCFAIFSYF